MPRSLQEILTAQVDLADTFEHAQPTGRGISREEILNRRKLRAAAREMSHAHRAIVGAVIAARADEVSWKVIGDELGTSGEAARQRFAGLVQDANSHPVYVSMDSVAPAANDESLAYYFAELTKQSQYAAIAAEHLNAAYEPRPGPAPEPGLTRSFAAIQSLLAAAAVVSKLLWSTGGPIARQRAQQLRIELGVHDDDLRLLHDRAVRDSLEHVDERIDGYLVGRRPQLKLSVTGVETPLHGGPLYLRRIDRDRGVVEVLGRAGAFDEVQVNELVDEMLDVQRRVNAWFAEHVDAP